MSLHIVSSKSGSSDVVELLWLSIIKEVGINTAELLSNSYFDPGRRVYAGDKYVYKIVLLEHEKTSRTRSQDMQGEYRILKDCAGIKGIPAAIQFQHNNDYEMLVSERLDGVPVNKFGILRLLLITCKLGVILFRLACRGISHNDIKCSNVLLMGKGGVSLIDFDQATRSVFIVGIIRSFLGMNIGRVKVHGSLMTVVKECVKEKLSLRTIKVLKKLMWSRVNNNLPVLAENASLNLKTLLEAWKLAQVSNASSPGVKLAYYSLDFEGYRFPGERSWEKRWEMLTAITDYSEKRILELGCNMSFLSCFLLKEKRAAATMGVDVDATILEAARLVASSLGVEPEYKQLDFDSLGNWEAELAEFKPDIVFALNVLNWVQDKKRFLAFLGCYNEVILEGHDDVETECNRFRTLGFNDIKLISTSERNRPIIHCKK